MMDKAHLHDKIHYWLLILIATCIPLIKVVLPILIMLLALNWVLSGRIKDLFIVGPKKWLVLLFTSFYFIHLIGLAYSSNMEFGFFDLEIKLSLLFFPILFASSQALSPIHRAHVLTGFIIGCLLGVLISMSNGFYNFYQFQDISYINYSRLSLFHHPGYSSMYLCLCIVIAVHFLIYQQSLIGKWQRIIFSVIIPVFSIFITLLMSKIGIICLAFVLLASLYVLIVVEKRITRGIVLSIVGVLLFYGLHKTIPRPYARFETAATTMQGESLNINSTESTTARLLIWPIAFELGKENPLLGVGTGDIKDELLIKYKEKNLQGILDRELNVHNQFLQTFAALGLTGLLLLLAGLTIPFVYCMKQKNWIYLSFIVIVALNCAIESIMEVQAGVVFYAFFNSFFALPGNWKAGLDGN